MSIYMWREHIPQELCFTANTANSTVRLAKAWSPTDVTLETSTDGSTRITYTIWDTITLANIWDKVYWRNTSETTTSFSTASTKYYQFMLSWSINASWDITSLINKNCTDTLVWDYCFTRLFYNQSQVTPLKTAPQLPATTLTSYCYNEMFKNEVWLTTAPQLPATTLASYCYYSMFFNCTSLETLPQLPATTLKSYCYNQMFRQCSKIKLSATQTWEYQTPYRIPTTWTWTTATSSLTSTFVNTWWTFTGNPTINTTYYTSNTLV